MKQKIKAPPKRRLLALLLAAVMTLSLAPSPVRVALADDTGTVDVTCTGTLDVPGSAMRTGVYEGTINGMPVHGVCANADASMPGNDFAGYSYQKQDPASNRMMWLAAIMAVYGTSDTHTDMQNLLNYINEGYGDLNADSIYGWMHIILSALHTNKAEYGGVSDAVKSRVNDYIGRIESIFSNATYAAYATSVMERYYCYYGTPPGGTGWQSFFFVGTKPPAKVKVKKSSAVPALTDGNDCYSLEGAVFGLYYSEEDARNNNNKIGDMTTDANGDTNEIGDLDARQYWIYETAVPRGFAKMPRPIAVTPRLGETTTVNIADVPQSDPVPILLRKVDATTGGAPASSQLSLEGARFIVRYYDGFYSTAAAAEASGSPTRSWEFETDSRGVVALTNAYKVSGDDLYIVNGDFTLPLGTIVIQESRAPSGYQRNDTKYVVQITRGGASEPVVNTYNAPTVSETVITGKCKIVKTSEDGKVAGIRFTVTGPNGYSSTPTTGTDGTFTLDNLYPGDYTVTETVPDKYKPQAAQTVTVKSGETKTVTFSNELKRGTLRVTKTSEDGLVAGMRFHLTGTSLSGATVDEYATTNASGVATFNDILIGTGYVLQEVNTPNRYIVPANQTVAINWNEVTNKSVENKLKRGDLKVTKTSEDGLVAGMRFHLTGTSLAGIAVDEYAETNASGVAEFKNILIGTGYTLQEVNTPNRYIVPANQTVAIEWNTVTNKTVENKLKRGDLKVTKTSEDGLVAGMRFHLTGTSLANIAVDEYATTDASGVAEFKNILIGEGYVLEEVNTAIRYVIPDSQTAEIEWNKVTNKSVENVLKKFRVTVTKSDAETTAAQGDATLEGAVYGMYKGDELIDTYTTDAAGKFTTIYYVCGDDWAIREITPSEGYLLDTVSHHVGAEPGLYTVELNDAADIDVTEQIIKGRIRLIKHSDEGDTGMATPEEGAVFEVWLTSAGSYAAAKETERETLTIDADGVAISKLLPYGTYTVHQTSGWPSSALVDDFQVVIREDGKQYSFILNNQTYTGYLKVVKTNARTGEVIPVAGVGFHLYSPTGDMITFFGQDTWYSGADGLVRVPVRLSYNYGYYLLEVPGTEPIGYVCATEPIYFDLTPDTLIDEYDLKIVPVNFPDEETKVQVFKLDADGDALPGATLAVIDSEDNVVEQWTTTDEPHIVYQLHVGETYTLRELTPVPGYVKAKDVSFVVANTPELQPVRMIDKQVFAEKVDVNGNGVTGARLAVYSVDAAGNADEKLDEWTTDGTAHAINGLTAGMDAILRELAAPEGYVKAKDVTFTVEDNGADQTVTMVDKQVTVTKLDVAGDELPGAEMSVTDAETGDTVDAWISSDTPHAISGLEVGKSYVLKEDTAPLGYVRALEIPFNVTDDGTDQHYDVTDKIVTVEKVDVGGAPVTGAKLAVYSVDAAGNADQKLDEWTTDGTPHAVNGLTAGEKVILRELKAPEGYARAKDVTFTVEDNGENQSVTMIDKTVIVAKLDVNSVALPGAKLAAIDAESGKTVDRWTSSNTPHAINGLEVGRRYIVRELAAPEGRVKAADVEFTVEDDGKNQRVVMIDKQITISKLDVAGEELPGAEMSVTDAETGRTVDAWISTEEPHAISGLEVGKSYVLKEDTAPLGFVRALDIAFTVTDDGANQHYDVVDKIVTVEKVDTDGAPVTGATLAVYAIKENGEAGKRLDQWISTDEPHAVNGLTVGEKFILRELDAPEGCVKAADVIFTVTDGTNQTVTMVDKTVIVDKLDPFGNGVEGAELAVYAVKPNGKIGKCLDRWTSDGTPHAVSGLMVGEAVILRELAAPDGWLLADDVAFTVLDDGRDQTVTMEDEEIPIIHTVATIDGDHVAYAHGTLELTERFYYAKLIPGREYTVPASVMVRETGEPLLDKDGKPVSLEIKFTPTKRSGFVDMTFTIDASELAGKTIVIFDDLYRDGRLLVEHKNINDENQSVHFPVVTTSATVDGEHVVVVTDKAVVTEAVAHRNLPVGRTYTIRTVAMVKETGKPLKDNDGKEITVEGTFTPETMDGKLETITLTFDASDLANKSVVIFEYVYDGDKLICAHDDINDEQQTVRFKPHPIGRLTIYKTTDGGPGTGDNGTLPLYAGLGTASLIGVACWVFLGQRKKGKREM